MQPTLLPHVAPPKLCPPFQDTTKRISAMQTQVRQETAKRTGDEQRMSHPLALVRDITSSSHTERPSYVYYHSLGGHGSSLVALNPCLLRAVRGALITMRTLTPLPAVEPLHSKNQRRTSTESSKNHRRRQGRLCRQQTPVPIDACLPPVKDKSFLGGEDLCLRPFGAAHVRGGLPSLRSETFRVGT